MLAGLIAVADPQAADVIGPYGALVLALAAIAWLIKDRVRIIADRDAERSRTEAARDRGDRLYDELVAQGKQLIPIVEHVEPTLRANTRALERLGETIH